VKVVAIDIDAEPGFRALENPSSGQFSQRLDHDLIDLAVRET
jgi:hypothetical protein